MKNVNRVRLYKLLKMSTEGLYQHLQEFLGDNGYDVIADGDNYIIGLPPSTALQSDITLVAHIDTLTQRERVLVEVNGVITNKNGVLGADDRAGVYAVMEMVITSPRKPIVIFTNHEERGGRGVQQLCASGDLLDFIHRINLFIEMDRQGANEFVYYSPILPEEIRDFVTRHGYEQARGVYSDVADLTDACGVPHLNLSIGYYFEHSPNERLVLSDMANTIERVYDMLQEQIPRTFVPSDVYEEDEEFGDDDELYPHFMLNPSTPLGRALAQMQPDDEDSLAEEIILDLENLDEMEPEEGNVVIERNV